jgi:hypothetical protein
MKTQKKIEQCLKAAPRPPAPDGLLERLQADISAWDIKTHRSVLRRWFAPSGGRISPWRVAAAVAIAIAVLLPLSYGTTNVIKYFKVFEARFVYPEDDGGALGYGVGAAIGSSDPNVTEEDAHKAEREFYELYKQGKAKEVKPGMWFAILSNGKGFGYGGDPEMLGLSEAERKEFLKKQFDEIEELRKAGKFEKIYKPEHDYVVDGIKYRYFEARYILSDGTVKTLGASEPVLEDDKNKD